VIVLKINTAFQLVIVILKLSLEKLVSPMIIVHLVAALLIESVQQNYRETQNACIIVTVYLIAVFIMILDTDVNLRQKKSLIMELNVNTKHNVNPNDVMDLTFQEQGTQKHAEDLECKRANHVRMMLIVKMIELLVAKTIFASGNAPIILIAIQKSNIVPNICLIPVTVVQNKSLEDDATKLQIAFQEIAEEQAEMIKLAEHQL